MVDLGDEVDVRRLNGILFRNRDFQLEDAIHIGGVLGADDSGLQAIEPISPVRRPTSNSWRRLQQKL